MMEELYAKQDTTRQLRALSVDYRNPTRKKVVVKKFAFFYAHRPRHPSVWYLSPYEFAVYWEPQLARYPVTAAMLAEDADRCHAVLTECGLAKLQQRASGHAVGFWPGVDYRVEAEGGQNWLALPSSPETDRYRHEWVLVRLRRPKDPTFARVPMPKKGAQEIERSASLVMPYFHPFTLRREDASDDVPYLGDLRGQHESWEQAMLSWFDGRVLCGESKRYIDNFLAVTRTSDKCSDDDENSDDLISDEELFVQPSELKDALDTNIRGREEDDDEADNKKEGSRAAVEMGKAAWPVCDAIARQESAWMHVS